MLRLAPIALTLPLVCAACGGTNPQHKSQLDTLQREIAVLKDAQSSQQSRIEHLRDQVALLNDRLEARQLHPGAVSMVAPAGRPLPVVKLRPPVAERQPPVAAPSAPAEPAQPVDTRPPVTITQADLDAMSPAPAVAPRRLPGRPVPPPANAAMAGNLGVVPLAPRGPRGATPRSTTRRADPARSDPAVTAYKRAYDLYRNGNFSAAGPALKRFVRDHAQHDYADNALFWVGKIEFDQSRFSAALATFRRVVSTWPAGNKVPDALLMIGLTQAKLGQGAEGRETLARLRAMYPQTEAARKADARLNDRAGSM